jgi:drug/metabolite transporter (DMT)-like permease
MTPSARRVFLAGLALAVAGSVLFSGKAVVVKLAYRYGVDPTTLITLRMLFAVPFFALTYVLAARGAAPLARADHGRIVVIGLLGYYAASYLDFLGLQYITAGLERLILYLNPTIVLLLSVLFLGKKLARTDGIALLLAYGGIAAAFWHDVRFEGDDTGLGAALVFGSAVSYAIYLVMAGELVRRVGALRLTSYAMMVSTLAVALQFVVLNPLAALVQPAEVYWLSLVNALFCTVLPVFATMLAIERIGAGNTSLAAMIGPVATIALAWTFLGEAASAWQWAGTALVLAGVYVLSSKGWTQPRAAAAVADEVKPAALRLGPAQGKSEGTGASGGVAS